MKKNLRENRRVYNKPIKAIISPGLAIPLTLNKICFFFFFSSISISLFKSFQIKRISLILPSLKRRLLEKEEEIDWKSFLSIEEEVFLDILFFEEEEQK